jgi:hypothetical protein
MTKRMVNVTVLVAVLAVAVMAPSMSFAAGHGSAMVSAEGRGSASLFEMLLRLVGFNPVTGSTKNTPTQTVSPSSGSISSPGYSTEEAIWGGSGRCQFRC